ncbi:MAG TPA: hypothetical protein VE153_25765 [Myxococcus sp.]|nr:hypothetical protein [Myxococcus sp.]
MIPRIVAVASLAVLLGTACGPAEPESPPAPSTTEGTQEGSPPGNFTGEEANDALASKAPEYAGWWFESGKPVVAAVDASDEAKDRLRAAILPQLTERGLPPDVELEFRRVAYSWNQLHAWKVVMRNTGLAAPSFSSLDANEVRNRVVVGLADLSQEAAVRHYAESEGVPREALMVEFSAPIRLLPGGAR